MLQYSDTVEDFKDEFTFAVTLGDLNSQNGIDLSDDEKYLDCSPKSQD